MGEFLSQIDQVLTLYFDARVASVFELPGGLVNRTYRVVLANGQEYIVQRLSTVFGQSAIVDMRAITQHVSHKGILTPQLILTKAGEVSHKDADGYWWKVMTVVTGDTYHSLTDARIAREAGRLLGEFHQGVADFSASRLQNTLTLHDTQRVFADFQKIYPVLMSSVNDAKFLQSFEFVYTQLPKTFLPDSLPRSVVHGDPKISNFIFNRGSGVCVIDLDTCMSHTRLVDLGDAFRSWCGKEEDDPGNNFNLEFFSAGLRGYESKAALSEEEKTLLYQSLLLVTLELAARFAIDVVNDNYFGWDQSRFESRKDHNLARVQGQASLAHDIISKQDEIVQIIDNNQSE